MIHVMASAPEVEGLDPREWQAVDRCPLCDDSRSRRVRRLTDPSGTIAGVFELRRCAGCDLVYVDPRPSDEALTALYDRGFYYSAARPHDALGAAILELIQSKRRRRIERYLRLGRLLDIGCGDGAFVHHMAGHGWEATGLDFSPAAIESARRVRNGARFLQGTLEDLDFVPGRLDVVTMWQVLEHIGEPRPTLARCHDLLKPGGLLVVAVPNIDGWSARLTGERWWGLDVPRHLVHYTPETLRLALEHAGFRVVRVRHRSMQYDPYGLLHSTLDWVFTRRHFLSEFAKRNDLAEIGRLEYGYNVAALCALGPVLAPLSLATTSIAALCRGGGFIEAHARRS